MKKSYDKKSLAFGVSPQYKWGYLLFELGSISRPILLDDKFEMEALAYNNTRVFCGFSCELCSTDIIVAL